MAKKKPKLNPLIFDLCQLQDKFAKAGFHITARKMNLAIKAFGWEAVTKMGYSPPKGLTKKEYDRLEKAHTKAVDKAWFEIAKLPEPPV